MARNMFAKWFYVPNFSQLLTKYKQPIKSLVVIELHWIMLWENCCILLIVLGRWKLVMVFMMCYLTVKYNFALVSCTL